MNKNSVRIVAIVLIALLCLSLLPLAAYAAELPPEIAATLEGEAYPPHEHVYDQAIVDERYLHEAGDCTPGIDAPYVYYLSCVCGESAEMAYTIAFQEYMNACYEADALYKSGGSALIDWDRLQALEANFRQYLFEYGPNHHYIHYEEPATCGKDGVSYDECEFCCDVQNEVVLPATGQHSYGEDGVCTVCGAVDPAWVAPVEDEAAPAADDAAPAADVAVPAADDAAPAADVAAAAFDAAPAADDTAAVFEAAPAADDAAPAADDAAPAADDAAPAADDAAPAADAATAANGDTATANDGGNNGGENGGAYEYEGEGFVIGGDTATANDGGQDRVTVTGGDDTLQCALVNNTLTAVPMDGDPADYTYQWYRAVTRNSGESPVGNQTANYQLTDSDIGHYVYCIVTPTGGSNGMRSAAYYVRKAISFNLQITGMGTVTLVKTDGITGRTDSEPLVPVIPDHTVDGAMTTTAIHCYTGDTIAISMVPYSFGDATRNDYVVRSINNAELSPLAPGQVDRSFRTNVNTDGATYSILFDVLRNYAENGPTEDGDIAIHQTGRATILVGSLKEKEAIRLGVADPANFIDYGDNPLRYVTPVWLSNPTAPTSNQISSINGFLFTLDYPGASNKNDFRILVYHYNNGNWDGPLSDEYITLLDDCILVRYNVFSPFTVLALPNVTLSFDGNGATSGSMGNKAAVKDESLTVPACAFTKEGYIFDKWLGSDGNEYDPGQPIKMTGDKTLIAQWKPAAKIIFDKNAADATGSIDEMIVPRAETCTLPMNNNAITRESFTFLGWKDQHGNAYADGAVFTPDDKLAAGESVLTLFAQWERSSYVIRYDGSEGGGTMDPQSVAVGAMVTLNANAFTNPPGYTFAGWSETAGGGIDHPDKDSFIPTSDMVLHAVWRETRKVHFYPNGGSGSYQTQDVPDGVPTALTKLSALGYTAPEGLTFAGWNTVDVPTETNPGVPYADGAEVTLSGGDLQLYAQWLAPVTVTYHANYGSDLTRTQEMAVNTPTKLDKNLFIRTGFKFDGWMSSSGGTAVDYVDEGTYAFSQDTDLYAKWSKQRITGTVVALDSDGRAEGNVVAGETLTGYCSDSFFTEADYSYQWNRNGTPIPGATSKTFVVPNNSFGEGITVTVSVKDDTGALLDSKTSVPARVVGIRADSTEVIDIADNGAQLTIYSTYAMIEGVTEDMRYTINGVPFTDTADHLKDGTFYAWLPGTYVFTRTIDTGTYSSDPIEITAWNSVGYAIGTSSGSSSSSSGKVYMYNNGTQMTSATRTDDVRYVEGSSSSKMIFLVRKGASNRISIRMVPSTGSYVHYTVNEGTWSSSGSEITRYLGSNGVITSPQLVSIVFNKSSSSPRTGDMSRLGLWSGLCAVSLVGAAAILSEMQKRRKSQR